MLSIYLGGPMAACSEEEMTGWRKDIKSRWPEFNYLDPCDRTYTPQQWRKLVRNDVEDILEADVVLTYMWKPGIGSSMELVIARYEDTPTIVVVPDFKFVSPWIREYADYLVEDFETAFKIIKAEWTVDGTHL